MKAWESAEYCKTRLGRSEPLGKIDRSKLNVRGSSIALGHPFAATGAKIVGVLAKILHSAGPGKRTLSSFARREEWEWLQFLKVRRKICRI